MFGARPSLLLSTLIASTSVLAPTAFAAINAADDIRQVPQNTAVVIDVLANDTTNQTGLVVESFSAPAQGTVTNVNGGLRYQPNVGFYGDDVFTYTITNSTGERATAQVAVSVLAEQGTVVAASIAKATPRAAVSAMRSHRDAVSMFMDAGSYASLNEKDVAGAGRMLGGAAGDGGLAFGGVFLSVNNKSGEQDAGNTQIHILQNAYQDDLTGFTLGADMAWGPHWTAGAAIGASQSEVRFSDAKGDFSLDDTSVLGFASYRGNAITVQAQMGYAALDYQFELADTQGNSRFGLLKAQYAFHAGAWQFIPALSLNYSSQFIEAYKERPSALTTSFSSKKTRALQSGLSLHIDRVFNGSWGVVIPRIAVTAEQMINTGERGVSGYAGSEYFELTSDEEDKSHVLVDMGVSCVLPRGLALFFNGQQLLLQDGYTSRTLQLGLRKEF